MTDRSEIERRFLALLRDYLDGCDERYPEGYEIEHFILVYHMRYAPREGETLEAWDGGPLPGWSSNVSQSSSTRTWWHDESLLAEALQQIRDEQWDQRHADDDDAQDGASSSEPDAEPDE